MKDLTFLFCFQRGEMSSSSWQMICGHRWAATGTLWQNHQTLTSWHPKAKFFLMRTRRSASDIVKTAIWMWMLVDHTNNIKMSEAVFLSPRLSLSKLCALPVERLCWRVAGQTRPDSMTLSPTGGSTQGTTPPCHSTLNLEGTSPCLWERYSIPVSHKRAADWGSDPCWRVISGDTGRTTDWLPAIGTFFKGRNLSACISCFLDIPVVQ